MMKCVSCNGTLRNTEVSCFLCGTAVPKDKSAVTLRDRCRSFIKFMFIFCSILTVASLFTDYTPSFIKCFVATLILALVKNSADQMAESR